MQEHMFETSLSSKGSTHNAGPRIILNVGGTKFETIAANLDRLPVGRLANLQQEGPVDGNDGREYYFDRNSKAFSAIMNFYRTGKLHMPKNMCGSEFRKELEFWRIDPHLIEECCWVRYKSSLLRDVEAVADDQHLSRGWFGYRKLAWDVLEIKHPGSITKVYVVLSSLLILALTVLKIYESLPADHNNDHHDSKKRRSVVLKPLLSTLLVLFILDFLARFVTCSEKKRFMLRIINIFDLVGILSIVAGLVAGDFPFVRLSAILDWFSMNFWICRCCRLLWFLRMSNFSLGFAYIIKKKWKEIFTILVSLFVICFAFSTIIIYLEAEQNSALSDIRLSLWWALITVTTVGYGDVYPVTASGRVIGVLCATSGLLFITCFVAAWVTWVGEYEEIGRYKKPKPNHSKCC